MKKINLNIFIIFSFILVLTSCQSARDGLIGGKRDNTDEFLVEKKNPLILPPKFNKLPKPTNSNSQKNNDNSENNNIEKLIGVESGKKTSNKKSTGNNSLENSILKTLNES
tara:strand:+ start:114 stop:446 length:333 start_codon:yes stop_codon:yes gene_type:complete